MIPIDKIKAIVIKHDSLEKELSSGNIDTKNFAQKSKEYSDLGNIVKYAREFLKFEEEKKDLEQIVKDSNSDKEMVVLAEKELEVLVEKKINYEKKLKLFLLPKDLDDQKNSIVEIRAGTGGFRSNFILCRSF